MIVSHTHWDPEWYSSYQEYRVRLVWLVDKLLRILDSVAEYRYFMFDGQVSAICDYLEVRPERKGDIQRHVRSGRLLVGPWFTMPEEFMPSPESHIRNLKLGHKLGNELGGVMKVGYLCDPVGHIAQMPQILNGFGIEDAVAWRGVTGHLPDQKSEVWWRSPDGSQVLLGTMPYGYCTMGGLTGTSEDFAKKFRKALGSLKPLAASDVLLFMQGCDHEEPLENLPGLIYGLRGDLSDEMAGLEVVQATLPQYFQALRSRVLDGLSTLQCELRRTRTSYVLPGILSTRMEIKTALAASQDLLERWAEPACTMAWLWGGEYPKELLGLAWRNLLRNNFHDSIYGAHADHVTPDVMNRFKASQEIASTLANVCLYEVAKRIAGSGDSKKVVVFNPSPWQRDEVVSFGLDFDPSEPDSPFVPVDEEGHALPFQIVDRQNTWKFKGPRGIMEGYVGGKPVRRISLAVLVKDIPPVGGKPITIEPLKHYRKRVGLSDGDEVHPNLIWFAGTQSVPEPDPEGLVRSWPSGAENDFLKIEINQNGTLKMTHKPSGKVFDGLNYFEDSGDRGDNYTFSAPLKNSVITTLSSQPRIEWGGQGPVLSHHKVSYRLDLPSCLCENRTQRSSTTTPNLVETTVILRAGSEVVEIETTITNASKDHRLRAVFPTGIACRFVDVDSQFYVVRRDLTNPDSSGWPEKPSPYNPARRFVSMSDGVVGFAVINHGIPEYEARKDGTIALTLLRSTGFLSVPGLPERSGRGSGPGIETPGAHCLGEHSYRYALYPHPGNWVDALVHRFAEAHNCPCRCVEVNPGSPKQESGSDRVELPGGFRLLEELPEQVMLSAVKKCEDRDTFIVRMYNLSGKEVITGLKPFWRITQAWLVNLNEDGTRELNVNPEDHAGLDLIVGPHQVVTVECRVVSASPAVAIDAP